MEKKGEEEREGCMVIFGFRPLGQSGFGQRRWWKEEGSGARGRLVAAVVRRERRGWLVQRPEMDSDGRRWASMVVVWFSVSRPEIIVREDEDGRRILGVQLLTSRVFSLAERRVRRCRRIGGSGWLGFNQAIWVGLRVMNGSRIGKLGRLQLM
ncbi:hypothetical protein HAX54_009645, partial [Datura stramonium]|nr:hypothetical protein [Datura stramonium]